MLPLYVSWRFRALAECTCRGGCLFATCCRSLVRSPVPRGATPLEQLLSNPKDQLNPLAKGRLGTNDCRCASNIRGHALPWLARNGPRPGLGSAGSTAAALPFRPAAALCETYRICHEANLRLSHRAGQLISPCQVVIMLAATPRNLELASPVSRATWRRPILPKSRELRTRTRRAAAL